MDKTIEQSPRSYRGVEENANRIDVTAQAMAYRTAEEWAECNEQYKEHWRQRAKDALAVADEFDRKSAPRFHAAFQAALAVSKANGYSGMGVAVVHKMTRAALDAADWRDDE